MPYSNNWLYYLNITTLLYNSKLIQTIALLRLLPPSSIAHGVTGLLSCNDVSMPRSDTVTLPAGVFDTFFINHMAYYLKH
jgi:hypothetical protein